MLLWRDNVQSGFQLVLALLNDTRVTDKLVFSRHGMELRDERKRRLPDTISEQ